MKNKKIIIGVLLTVLIVVVGIFVFLNQRTVPTKVITSEVIVEEDEVLTFNVKTSPWKPYMYEEEGEYKGISFELLDLVMSRLGVNYKFELIPWSRAMKMAEAGKVDALLSAAYSEDRESFISYTPEQRDYGLNGIIPSAYLHIIEGIFLVQTTLKDEFIFDSFDQILLDGTRIGVNQGYSYKTTIENSNFNKISHVTEQESLEALINGEIDMFLTHKEVGLAILNEMGLQDKVSIAKGPFPFQAYYFLLFSKNSDYPDVDKLQRQVDEELVKIHESGEYEKIYKQYVTEEE